MTENIEVFINNSIRIRDRIGTIYIAGDTDVTKEAKAVKCDIALVPSRRGREGEAVYKDP